MKRTLWLLLALLILNPTCYSQPEDWQPSRIRFNTGLGFMVAKLDRVLIEQKPSGEVETIREHWVEGTLGLETGLDGILVQSRNFGFGISCTGQFYFGHGYPFPDLEALIKTELIAELMSHEGLGLQFRGGASNVLSATDYRGGNLTPSGSLILKLPIKLGDRVDLHGHGGFSLIYGPTKTTTWEANGYSYESSITARARIIHGGITLGF